jgi:catechol 2,3-dioxygenase-like lactoylglutathione lyase family enzyme
MRPTQIVSRLNVVYVYVRDVARSRAFYRDQLGIALEGDEHWQQADLGGSASRCTSGTTGSANRLREWCM